MACCFRPFRPGLQRRSPSWLAASLILGLLLLPLFPACGIDPPPLPSTSPVVPANPRHVILFIGDGMGLPSEELASRYLYGQDQGLVWQGWADRGWVTTWDVTAYNTRAVLSAAPLWNAAQPAVNNPLTGYNPLLGGNRPWPANLADGVADNLPWLKLASTDSASAATAMACGSKTDTGNIAWAPGDPAGGALLALGPELAARQATAWGIISTVPLSHATPAAFGAHSTSRSAYTALARELFTVARPQVLIGGGHPGFATGIWLEPALLTELRDSPDWVVAERSLGGDGNASLQQALERLSPDQHLLGLYGGADGAFEAPVPVHAPGNPSLTRVSANPSLAHAVITALTHLVRSGTGCFLMVEQGDIDWANHNHTLPRMIGAVASLDEAVRATLDYIDQPGDALSRDNTLVLVTADHATGALRYDPAANPVAGSLNIPGLAWNSGGHSNDLVGLYAWGAGASWLADYQGLDHPGTAILDNTAIHQFILDFATGN